MPCAIDATATAATVKYKLADFIFDGIPSGEPVKPVKMKGVRVYHVLRRFDILEVEPCIVVAEPIAALAHVHPSLGILARIRSDHSRLHKLC